jgi:catechol 2,3-dioxygenase-like lactoylglutathione lyase family enzyme
MCCSIALVAAPGVGIRKAKPEYADVHYDQGRPGVHHLCFRARSREDVDTVYQFVQELGAHIVHSPQDDNQWAPGYYSILFEDPDGTRLEVNHVPGKGNLDPAIKLPVPEDVQAKLSQW